MVVVVVVLHDGTDVRFAGLSHLVACNLQRALSLASVRFASVRPAPEIFFVAYYCRQIFFATLELLPAVVLFFDSSIRHLANIKPGKGFREKGLGKRV
jgi:hypothetical protein